MFRTCFLLLFFFQSQNAYSLNLNEIALAAESIEIKADKQWYALNCKMLTCKKDGVAKIDFVGGKDTFETKVKALKDLRLNGIRISTVIDLKGEQYFLSEGFQSWSNSGWLKVPSNIDLKRIYNDLRGDDENRSGVGYSYNYTMVSNRDKHYFLGTTKASKFQSWIIVQKIKASKIKLTLMMGDVGEDISLRENDTYTMDPWFVSSGEDAEKILRDYSSRIDSYKLSHYKRAKVGWNSWYEMWSKVTLEGINAHIDIAYSYLDKLFTDADLETPDVTMVIDDGWELLWGDWYFKEGFKGKIENTLRKMEVKGVEAGIWVAPFLASPKSNLYNSHPNWFVANASYSHPTGKYYILDLTHPEALEFLQASMKRLVDMGFKKLKIDFLMTATYPGKRYLDKTGLEAYEMGMEAIREAVGDDVYLLACGAPSLASLPYVDSWRQGADIAFEFPTDFVGPSWTDVVDQLRNLSARWFLCDITSCDVDPWLLRKPHNLDSSQAAAWVVALGGGGLYLSDDMRNLSDDRLDWSLPRTLLEQSVSGFAGHPIGVIPDKISTHLKSPSILDRILKINRLIAPEKWVLPSGKTIVFDLPGKKIK